MDDRRMHPGGECDVRSKGQRHRLMAEELARRIASAPNWYQRSSRCRRKCYLEVTSFSDASRSARA